MVVRILIQIDKGIARHPAPLNRQIDVTAFRRLVVLKAADQLVRDQGADHDLFSRAVD
jgi:hypothetical protein